ncbi:MAG: ABC transporter permease [bacterium]
MTGNLSASLSEALGLLLRADAELWRIVLLSLFVSSLAVTLSALLALPVALAVAWGEFPGKRIVIGLVNSLIAVPAVVIGLLLYLALSRSGPFGALGLLFTPRAMILAQALLALPLLTGLFIAAFQSVGRRVKETALTLGASPLQAALALLREARFALLAAYTTGFARLLGETGMTMMVGGNIRGQTRVMTTAIALETLRGNFELGIALGIILFTVAIGVNIILQIMQGRAGR